MSLAQLPAPESVIGVARDAVAAAYGQPLWQCTDDDLVEEISAALALRAQADAVLLARLAEADSRKLSTRRGFRSLPAWLRATLSLAPGEAIVLPGWRWDCGTRLWPPINHLHRPPTLRR